MDDQLGEDRREDPVHTLEPAPSKAASITHSKARRGNWLTQVLFVAWMAARPAHVNGIHTDRPAFVAPQHHNDHSIFSQV